MRCVVNEIEISRAKATIPLTGDMDLRKILHSPSDACYFLRTMKRVFWLQQANARVYQCQAISPQKARIYLLCVPLTLLTPACGS